MLLNIFLLNVALFQVNDNKTYPFDINQSLVVTDEQLRSMTYGSVDDPLDDLDDSQFLPSIDLREYGLVSYIQDQTHGCQSCYAHAAISMIESAYLRSASLVCKSEELKDLWCFNYSTAKISTSFLMTNSGDQAMYCAYGSGQGVIYTIVHKYGGYELETTYPKNFALYQSMFYREEELPMKVPRERRFFPFKLLSLNGYAPDELSAQDSSQNSQIQTLESTNLTGIASRFQKELLNFYNTHLPKKYKKSNFGKARTESHEKAPRIDQKAIFVHIYYNQNKPYGPDIVRKIKSYLSRGITLMVGLNSGGPQAPHYYVYHGDENLVLRCKEYIPHHLVQIIGYGKHRGKDVLVYKNSWGLDWGAFGSFFVEIGTNAACIEQDVVALIPAGYDPTDRDTALLPPVKHIRGGKYARYLLDMDPGDVRTEIPTDSWYAENFMTLVRNQSIDMVLILFFSLLGLATTLGYLVIDGVIMFTGIFRENKKMKQIIQWKLKFKEQLQQRDNHYKGQEKDVNTATQPTLLANSENYIDEDDYREEYQINDM